MPLVKNLSVNILLLVLLFMTILYMVLISMCIRLSIWMRRLPSMLYRRLVLNSNFLYYDSKKC